MSHEVKTPSEQLVTKTWDRCINTFVINTGIGLGLGILASAFLFQRRISPVLFTTGFGMGMSQAQCQFEFAHPELFHGRRVKIHSTSSSPSVSTVVVEDLPASEAVHEAAPASLNQD